MSDSTTPQQAFDDGRRLRKGERHYVAALKTRIDRIELDQKEMMKLIEELLIAMNALKARG